MHNFIQQVILKQSVTLEFYRKSNPVDLSEFLCLSKLQSVANTEAITFTRQFNGTVTEH